MKKNIIWATIALGAFVAGIRVGQPSTLHTLNYNTLPYKIEVIKAHIQYYDCVETLLDSVASQCDDFMDVTMESDEYYFYWEAKQRVDSLNALEM